MPMGALTAWQALVDVAQLHEGQTILIHGGFGGVGTFAIQIAKVRGARVIATASTANQDLLRQLGADVAIDYTKQKFEEIAKDVDCVLDPVGKDTLARLLRGSKKRRHYFVARGRARSRGSQETRHSRGRHLGETERERSFRHRPADRRGENQTSCHESSAAE